VALAAGAVVAVYLLWPRWTPALVAGLIGAVAFACAVWWHRRVLRVREALERLALVLSETFRRCGSVVSLRSPDRPAEIAEMPPPIVDEGPVWRLSDQERDDLDVYASPVGVFGLLNRTSTPLGARRLADMLDGPLLSCERIRARQRAVRWLTEHPQNRLAMLAACAQFRGFDGFVLELLSAVRHAFLPPKTVWRRLLRIWSVASGIMIVALVAVASLAGDDMIAGGAAVGFIINLSIYGVLRRSLNATLNPWRRVENVVTMLEPVVGGMAANLPDETPLRELRRAFGRAAEASVLPALRRRVAWTNAGGLVHALLNIVFFYDWHLAQAIRECVFRRRRELLEALAALADLEALLSLACFSWEEPVVCWPEPADAPGVRISQGRHPLISPEWVVPNDAALDLDKRLWIITGANASGKSTFLRMVGVSVLLGQVGAAAPALSMAWSPVCLMTDLQVRDDLSQGESYFLAEVRHLRRLVCSDNVPAPVLGLIDEPFRGTNSREKRAAGMALVAHQLANSGFFLVATHDLALSRFAGDGGAAENYHFHGEYLDGAIRHDFRLRPGPATTTTAIHILRQEGYPQAFLDDAQCFLSE